MLYRYIISGQTSPPTTFRELVTLVHDGKLSADDLVKSDLDTDWHPAAEVIGLFHMAGRDDVLKRWQLDQQKQADQIDESEQQEPLVKSPTEFNQSKEDYSDNDESKAKQEAVFNLAHPAHPRVWGPYSPEFDHPREMHSDTIDPLAASQKSFVAKPSIKRLQHLFSPQILRQGFRWMIALAVANLVGLAILNWSQTEMRRFPDRWQSTRTVFPVWGQCSQLEYTFLMIDTMLIAGGVGYFIGRELEMRAD